MSDVEVKGDAAAHAAEERARLRALAEARLREREGRLRAKAEREAREAERGGLQAERAALQVERDARQAALRAEAETRLRRRQERASTKVARKLEREAAVDSEARGRRATFIHIGLKKSGSASIQSFLTANEEALADIGLDYPKGGRGPFKDHHNIACEVQDRPKFDPRHGTLDELVADWRGSEARVHLLSSEMFEGCKASQIAQIKASLDHGRGRQRVILIVRDLIDIIPSSYAQKIKLGAHDYDFDRFFEQRIGESRTDYFQTARRWAEVFGWDSLRVRLLDRGQLVNGDLIDDFLSVLGFDPNTERMRALARPGAVNVSPGWRVLEAIRAFVTNRHGLPGDHPLRKIKVRRIGPDTLDLSLHRKRFGAVSLQVGEAMGWNADRGLYLTSEQAEQCLAQYRRTIERFNAVLTKPLPAPRGLDERGFTPRPWLPDAERIAPRELRAFYDQVGRLLIGRKALL